MADKTTGELGPVKESPISGLPAVLELYDNTLIPVEQQGNAMHMTGRQFREFGENTAKKYVQTAVDAAKQTGKDLQRVEELRKSIEVDYDALEKAVNDAENSASKAKDSEDAAKQSAQNAADSESEAQKWAGVAEAEAERATVPAVEGVYNVILTDRVTDERYALLVENGRLVLLGVSDEFVATNMLFIDRADGVSYTIVIDNGRLSIEEAV